MKNKLLLTGNCGFIFSHVTDYFLELGWQVVGIDNLSAGSHPELLEEWKKYDNFKFYEMDLSSREVIEVIRSEAPQYVVHAGAYSDVDYSIKYPYHVLEANILANLNVFEACRDLPSLKKLLYVSTDEIYGECEIKKNETDIIFPKNPYSCSKAVGSLMRLAFDNSFPELKDKTTEIRMCNIFGERQDKRKIMPAIKESLEGNYSIPLHNGGVGYREYLYVKNVPPMIKLVLEKGHRTYNVTNNDLYSVNELIGKAQSITKKKCTVHDSHREGMDSIYQMDSSRLRELGWTPRYSFEESLTDYLQ